MLENKKNREFSQIRQAEKRIWELHKERNNMQRVPLDKKIFAGHWRFFAVRADVLRSSIGEIVGKIVEACNSYRFGDKKDPKSFQGSSEIRSILGDQQTLFVADQYLRPLNQAEFEKLELTEGQKRKWFVQTTKQLSVGTKNIPIHKYFPNVPPHMLELTYKPAYITEVSIPDGDKETELVRLYQFMTKTNGWEKLHGHNRETLELNLSRKNSLEKVNRRESA